MPKVVPISRRKQAPPSDIDAFRKKRKMKQRKAAQEEPAELSEGEKARELDAALADSSDDGEQAVASSKGRRSRASTADDSSDESSSLSVGAVGDEFEALKQSIAAGVQRDAKKQKKVRAKKQTGDAADSAKASGDGKAKSKKQPAAAKKEKELIPELMPAVVYVGHLPWGLEERQLREFFSQFGELGRVKLARNKRTGSSRHFAFVEFIRMHIAKTVVDVMDGYIMFRRRLVCKLVPEEKCHEGMFAKSHIEHASVSERRAAAALAHGTGDAAKKAARQKRNASKRQKKLEAAGIKL